MQTLDKKYRGKGTTITIGNRKGGVSKTTNTVLISYSLAKRGIRTLVVDLDPQSNATKTLFLTKMAHDEGDEIATIDTTLMKAVAKGSLDGVPVSILPNLDLVANYIDFGEFAKYLYTTYDNDEERDYVISNLLEPLKKDYDVILIDVPPASMEVSRCAIVASDYVLIPLQTQEHALSGAEEYIMELERLNIQYNLGLQVLGILPVLLKHGGSVDAYILQEATEIFGRDNVFETIIKQMERIKRFDVSGVIEKDRHDLNVIEKYNEVTDEFLKRLNRFEAQLELEEGVEQ